MISKWWGNGAKFIIWLLGTLLFVNMVSQDQSNARNVNFFLRVNKFCVWAGNKHTEEETQGKQYGYMTWTGNGVKLSRKFRSFLRKLRVISTDDLGTKTFTYIDTHTKHTKTYTPTVLVHTDFTQTGSTRRFLSVSFSKINISLVCAVLKMKMRQGCQISGKLFFPLENGWCSG